jgi:Na+/H+ antiporter NhaD/arsenite permease-like protein
MPAPVPHLLWTSPFALLLLCIAFFPLIPRAQHWWEKNSSKLIVSLVLAVVTCLYYLLRKHGFHGTPAGFPSLLTVLNHSVIEDYIPFIILLFSLYTISGGINLKGDIPAHPATNTLFLAAGAILASLLGTTGAAMLLIRPLLQINSDRKHVKHTVVFFIFLVCNIGGCLLPIGDPPLFLGYLRGVPFLWTLNLWKEWAACTVITLFIYVIWEGIAYRTEAVRDLVKDEGSRVPLALTGKRNLFLLAGVVFAVALFVPNKPFPGTSWKIPDCHLREIVLVSLAILSLVVTPKDVHKNNDFNFHAIVEVACLFIGIFITMQAPIEILQLMGSRLGLTQPWQFFWISGGLSSFLDNAPTYVVFFSTAAGLDPGHAPVMNVLVAGAHASIPIPLLTAVSCGSVFMGANTYIGNGPNFMVKSIAERSGVKMPSFFGYMLYSVCILIPVFLLVTFVFFHP